jgi:hypothetical protein
MHVPDSRQNPLPVNEQVFLRQSRQSVDRPRVLSANFEQSEAKEEEMFAHKELEG